jgi:hypothetical protein
MNVRYPTSIAVTIVLTATVFTGCDKKKGAAASRPPVTQTPPAPPVPPKAPLAASTEPNLPPNISLGATSSAAIAAQIETRLSHPSAEVRRTAVDEIIDLAVSSPNLALPLLIRATGDKDPKVWEHALEQARQLPIDHQVTLFQMALHNENPRLKAKSLSLLAENPTPETFTVVVDAYRFDNPESLEAARDASEKMVGQRFQDFTKAGEWWEQNRPLLDENLRPLDP